MQNKLSSKEVKAYAKAALNYAGLRTLAAGIGASVVENAACLTVDANSDALLAISAIHKFSPGLEAVEVRLHIVRITARAGF